MLPNLTQTQNDQTAKIAANLDEQEKQRQQLIAQGDAQVQAMQENREQNDLLGLGQAYQTAKANQAQAMGMIAQGLGTSGYAAANGVFNGSGSTGVSGIGNIVDTPAQISRVPAISTVQNNPTLNGNSLQQFNRCECC